MTLNYFQEQIQKGKFIENYDYKNINKKLALIPLGNKKYIEFNDQNLNIIKEISNPTSKEFKSELLFKYKENNFKNFDLKNQIFKIIIKHNTPKELSLYILGIKLNKYGSMKSKYLKQLTIKNFSVLNSNTKDYDIKEIIIKDINQREIYDIIILYENNNLIFTTNGEICLYNDSFNERRNIDVTYDSFLDCIKINNNLFAYSLHRYNNHSIYIIKIDNTIIDKFEVKNCGKYFINFIEKRNLLITHSNNLIYIINFNNIFPEIIQKVDFIGYYKGNIYSNHNIYNYFKDDSIFFTIILYNESSKQQNNYFVQSKFITEELKEISKINI